MNDTIEINRFIKLSQCEIIKKEDWKYILYDNYNDLDVNTYKSLDINIILWDIDKHIKKNISNTLNDKTKEKLKSFFKEKFNTNLIFEDNQILMNKDDNNYSLKFNELESFNVNYLKLMLSSKIEE